MPLFVDFMFSSGIECSQVGYYITHIIISTENSQLYSQMTKNISKSSHYKLAMMKNI